jgi:TPP-dependent pyruvate/acetoin dehydrogenase alpha subunit
MGACREAAMTNVKPVQFDQQMTIRVDDEFKDAVEEIRADHRPLLAKTEAIRIAVLEKRERIRKSKRHGGRE